MPRLQLGLIMPIYATYNPAMAKVSGEHLFSVAMLDVMSVAMLDVMNNGMTLEQAIDKVFKRVEPIFAKCPIQQAWEES
jgi:hypothetical protein